MCGLYIYSTYAEKGDSTRKLMMRRDLLALCGGSISYELIPLRLELCELLVLQRNARIHTQFAV